MWRVEHFMKLYFSFIYTNLYVNYIVLELILNRNTESFNRSASN